MLILQTIKIAVLAGFIILIDSCSNTKELYKHYQSLPTSKTDTFQLYYDFVE